MAAGATGDLSGMTAAPREATPLRNCILGATAARAMSGGTILQKAMDPSQLVNFHSAPGPKHSAHGHHARILVRLAAISSSTGARGRQRDRDRARRPQFAKELQPVPFFGAGEAVVVRASSPRSAVASGDPGPDARGGILLAWIGYRLLAGNESGREHDVAPSKSFWGAMQTSSSRRGDGPGQRARR